jgi:hypothetical protein
VKDWRAREIRSSIATRSRRDAKASVAITSSSIGTARSAAAEGVGARTSATRSQIVMSTSCPTADIVGIGHRATARASRSSLNAQRSSRPPPPRPMITTSAARQRPTFSSAAQSSSIAPSP